MMRVFVAVMALATVASAPVSAQYYGGPPEDGWYEDEEDFAPPRRSYRRYSPRYGDPYGDAPPRYQRRARAGSVCVTSRGNCPAPGVMPLNAPCRCFIPGFGPKRGAVGF